MNILETLSLIKKVNEVNFNQLTGQDHSDLKKLEEDYVKTDEEIDVEKFSKEDVQKKNILLIDENFKKCGIQLTEQELITAQAFFVEKAKSIGIVTLNNNEQLVLPLINNNGLIDENILNRVIKNGKKSYRGTGSFEHLFRKFQNLNNCYVPEKKYSTNKNNEIGNFFREYNKLFENLKENFKLFNKNANINLSLEDSYRFTKNIQNLVKEKLGINNNPMDMVGAISDRNFIKYFFNNETYLTNSKLFWIVFDVVWIFSNFNEINYSQWADVFSKYDRLKGGFIDRIHLAKGKHYAKAVGDVLRNINSDDYLTVYRGFLVKKNCFVRNGITKNNNPHFSEQDEGKGYSYTLDKWQAIRFGSRYHFYHDFKIRKSFPSIFGNLSQKKIEKQLQNDYKKKLEGFYNQNYLNKETRRCFATYKIKKKNIIFADCVEKEAEIIADSNNVELVRYDFITDQMDNQSAIENAYGKGLHVNTHLLPLMEKLHRLKDFSANANL
jgi:hypothetical protein